MTMIKTRKLYINDEYQGVLTDEYIQRLITHSTKDIKSIYDAVNSTYYLYYSEVKQHPQLPLHPTLQDLIKECDPLKYNILENGKLKLAK